MDRSTVFRYICFLEAKETFREQNVSHLHVKETEKQPNLTFITLLFITSERLFFKCFWNILRHILSVFLWCCKWWHWSNLKCLPQSRNNVSASNDKAAPHILSCALVLEASAACHSRVHCSKIGHSDKLFTSDRWRWYKFLLCPACWLKEKVLLLWALWQNALSPINLHRAGIRRGFQVESSTSVNRQMCHCFQLKRRQWESRRSPPSFISPLSSWGHTLAELWQQRLIRKWLSIMDTTMIQFMFQVVQEKLCQGHFISHQEVLTALQ